MPKSINIAIIQASPAYLDLAGSLEKMEHYIKEAAGKGAKMIVFGETWLCGYPSWLDHCPNIALWDYEPTKGSFFTNAKKRSRSTKVRRLIKLVNGQSNMR